MSLSDTFETHVLNYLFTATSVTRPTAWYLGLYTSAPTDSASGTELSGSGYARQTVAFTVSGNLATNTSAVEFPTATGSWGTIVAVAVLDASSSGNILAYASLSANKTIATGDVLRIPAGDLDITLD
tara:strand:+ start:178 stop:558 length:381 start_codon:yes stop_codon:yes gene_type:complete